MHRNTQGVCECGCVYVTVYMFVFVHTMILDTDNVLIGRYEDLSLLHKSVIYQVVTSV